MEYPACSKDMHCLGAVTGGVSSPNGAGSRGSILSMFRALGVLVCEGRIQGPPRGYREGPHCAPPNMQAPPNEHNCEENEYLCDRYLVLLREITDRTAIGSFLCVEVLLCSDCPCGLAKATCKNPVYPLPSLSIPPWQQTSEMLLEYWCVSAVPSKSPETMNFQGLYQAVRSRLHFSQVAAWWSRSNGTEPRYIVTRVVPHNEENLRKFRETPVEHTFPLAGSGDGNSIKVTVWALPRMEEVPVLICPVHPTKDKDEEGVARALTPTKVIPGPNLPQNPGTLVMPALLDDRLQTPCNKSGKHHCRCEEEDCPPPSPTITRNNGERKRRRSLPCGPPESTSCVTLQPISLPSVRESTSTRDQKDFQKEIDASSSYPKSLSDPTKNQSACTTNTSKLFPKESSHRLDRNIVQTRNNLNSDHLERNFRSRLSIDERDGNLEKRYKRTIEAEKSTGDPKEQKDERSNDPIKKIETNETIETIDTIETEGSADIKNEKNGLFDSLIPFNPSLPWSFVESWNNSAANGKCGFQSLRANREAAHSSQSARTHGTKEPCVHVRSQNQPEPPRRANPFRETKPEVRAPRSKLKLDTVSICTVHRNVHQNVPQNVPQNLRPSEESRSKPNLEKSRFGTHEAVSPANEALELEGDPRNSKKQKDLSQLMSRLSFPEEKEKTKEEGGFLDWFSKVPGRVLGVTPTNGYVEGKGMKGSESKQRDTHGSEVKFKSCNLELSQREFDEVLAVLRARTPSGRRRAPIKTVRRRDRSDKSLDEGGTDKKFTNLENGESLSNVSTINRNNKQSCENCEVDFCRRTEQGVEEKFCSFDRRFCRFGRAVGSTEQKDQKNVNPDSIRTGLPTLQCSVGRKEQTEKRNDNPDCPQNVSIYNKADVLLGAILRTSKDRENVQDNTSNGTRPRTAQSVTKNEIGFEDNSESDSNEKSISSHETRNGSSDDEKSLPLYLNKRFTRFRQLFKKEQSVEERKANPRNEASFERSHGSRLANAFTLNRPDFRYTRSVIRESEPAIRFKESKARRRIDLSKFSVDVDVDVDVDVEEEECPGTSSLGKLSTNGAHQNSTIHSTNCKREGEHECRAFQDQCNGVHSTNRDEKSKQEGTIDRSASGKRILKNQLPGKNNFAATSQLSDHASSGPRSNNNNVKDEPHNKSAAEDESFDKAVPSAIEQERFRRSLENAASMVFHSRTGLPLTSSPAPLRRGSCCFDYDSSLNTVSSKRSALFELNTPPSPGAVSLEETDRETENAGDGEETPKRRTSSRHRPQSHALLGSFEESALNGRLEPVSTVHGFTAELGASGSFCPKHRKLPVTVFFYTLGDNDKVSTPYLAHINLGKKGYQVPRSGTIQVTLLNPLGTVVKMFVVLYDLSDMPPRSHTFLRQRTLRDKTLRYLVHLRFMSGKSGRIYLHTDIRMIICRKSDVDTASDFGSEPPKELRSYIHGPTNPKFSPRC